MLFNLCYSFSMNRSSYTRATDRNRRRIQEAFAELLAERSSITNITVTDLAERAEITRGTFYNYYNNLYEVGAEIQSNVEKQVFARWGKIDTVDDVDKYVDEMFLFLRSQEGVYRELLASSAIDGFYDQLEKGMSKRIIEMIREDGITDKEAELELLFTTNGAIAIVRKYYHGDTTMSLEEIRDYLKKRLGWIFKKYIDKTID